MTPAHDIPRSSISEAVELSHLEREATRKLLASLDEPDWQRPTDCTDWTVRDVVAHVIGQFEGLARPDRMLRRVRAARRMPGQGVLDGHNQLQVAARSGLSPQELIEQFDLWGTKGVRAMSRIPAPIRRIKVSRLFPEAVEMAEDSLDFLFRVVAPRDPWMHRIDIARATGRQVTPDDHDGQIVAQVVRDLAQAWTGPPVCLVLTGPAGGSWRIGSGSPVATVTAEAIEFACHVSGRPAATPEINGDSATAQQLLAARVVF